MKQKKEIEEVYTNNIAYEKSKKYPYAVVLIADFKQALQKQREEKKEEIRSIVETALDMFVDDDDSWEFLQQAILDTDVDLKDFEQKLKEGK